MYSVIFPYGGEVECCQKKEKTNLLQQHSNSCVKVTACELEFTEVLQTRALYLAVGSRFGTCAILRLAPIAKILQM